MTNIYIGNLDFAASEDQLRTLFAGYGVVNRVTIAMDRDTGAPRGFAFVEMNSALQAQHAIRVLNGSAHGGRTLMVNEARPKLYSNRERELLAARDHRRHQIERLTRRVRQPVEAECMNRLGKTPSRHARGFASSFSLDEEAKGRHYEYR